jgi:hypothetical protein
MYIRDSFPSDGQAVRRESLKLQKLSIRGITLINIVESLSFSMELLQKLENPKSESICERFLDDSRGQSFESLAVPH